MLRSAFGFFLGVLLVMAPCSVSALKYVRSAATGAETGADWNNAYKSLPDQLARGETYYIAAGTYPSVNIDDPIDNGKLITIKKATDANHGTTTGWVNNSSTHGNGQAVFRGISVETDSENYSGGDIVIDGAYEYGIKVTFGDGGVGVYLRGSNYTEDNKWNKNITLKYIEIAGPAGSEPFPYTDASRGLWIYAAPGLVVSHCSIHGSDTLIEGLDMDGAIIEHTKLFDSACTGSRCACCAHENVLIAPGSDDVHFRFNEVYNWQAEGVYPGYSGSGWRVYGNIFRDPIGGRAFEPHQFDSPQGPGRAKYGNFALYNNVFINVPNSINLRGEYSDAVRVYNNIFYNSGSPNLASDGYGTLDRDYNWYSGGSSGGEAHGVAGNGANPFLNLTGKNFRLNSSTGPNYPRDKGTVAGAAPFILDPDGRTRGGADGKWDIGAYEYGEQSTVPPSAPSNLTVQ